MQIAMLHCIMSNALSQWARKKEDIGLETHFWPEANTTWDIEVPTTVIPEGQLLPLF